MTESQIRERAPVFDFDIYSDPLLADDVHAGYLALKEKAPPLFWTPRNGGHWVALASTDVLHIMQHPAKFSNRQLSIPANPDAPRMIPESLDPPEHRKYRQFLRPWFESGAIAPREARITEWANVFVDRVTANGRCEFVDEIASRYPVSVFMEMFGLPLDRIDEFRDLITGFFKAGGEDDRQAHAGKIMAVLAELIQTRMADPQDDMVSALITSDFEGRKLDFPELMSIGFLMFLAGLDTVTNALTFGMQHLARNPEQQQQLIDNPDKIPDAVEELMRRYSFVAAPRQVTEDTELAGIKLKQGEMVSCALNLVGMDEKLNPDPHVVDFDRPRCRHAAFGNGIHTCLGIHLARLELATFYRLWLEKIGLFRLAPDAPKPTTRGGSVLTQSSLHLEWKLS
jgi:cytochrome P450